MAAACEVPELKWRYVFATKQPLSHRLIAPLACFDDEFWLHVSYMYVVCFLRNKKFLVIFLSRFPVQSFVTTKICAAEHGEVTAASNLWIKEHSRYLPSVLLKQTIYSRFMGEKSGMLCSHAISMLRMLTDWWIDDWWLLFITDISYQL